MLNHTLIVGDFNTPFLPLDRSSRQKLNKELKEVTDVMTQIDLTDIYRTFRTNIKEYTFLSEPHGAFLKLDHILGIKANLNRYKKKWNNPCIILNHHDLKLEFNTNTNFRKSTNTWKSNKAYINHQ